MSDASIAVMTLTGRIDALQEMQHASSARRGDILLTYVDLERWNKCTARKVRGLTHSRTQLKSVSGLPVCYCLVEILARHWSRSHSNLI